MSFEGEFAVIGAECRQAAAGRVNGGVVHVLGVDRFDQAVAVALLQLGEDLAVLRHERLFGGFIAGVERQDRFGFDKPVG